MASSPSVLRVTFSFSVLLLCWLWGGPRCHGCIRGTTKTQPMPARVCRGRSPKPSCQNTLQPKVSVTFPEASERFLMMRSVVALPDGSLLLGDAMADQPITRVILTHPPQVLTLPFPEPIYNGDVKSLAVLNDHQILMTTTDFLLDHDVLKLLHLDPKKEKILKVEDVKIGVHRNVSEWSVVAAGPEKGTFFLSGKDANTKKSFVDLITADGLLLDTLLDNVDFLITSMILNSGDLYMMSGWPYKGASYNIHKLNLASEAFSGSLGDLDVTSLGQWVYFFQGGFDGEGNLYIAAHNKTGCQDPQTWCCQCVILVTAEGEVRQLVNYSDDEREISAVIVTSSGFVMSSSIVDGFIKRRVAVDLFDLV